MSTFEIKGNLNIIKGKLKQKRAKLANNDLEYIAGKSEELLGRVQNHTREIHEAMKKSAARRCE